MESPQLDYSRRDYQKLKQEIRPVNDADRRLLRTWFGGRIIATALFLLAIAALVALAGTFAVSALRRPERETFVLAILLAAVLLLCGIFVLLVWGLVSAYRLISVKTKVVYRGVVSGLSDADAPSGGSRTQISSYFVFLDGLPFNIPKSWLRELKIGEEIEMECFETSRVADIRQFVGGAAVSMRAKDSDKKTEKGVVLTFLKTILDFLSF